MFFESSEVVVHEGALESSTTIRIQVTLKGERVSKFVGFISLDLKDILQHNIHSHEALRTQQKITGASGGRPLEVEFAFHQRDSGLSSGSGGDTKDMSGVLLVLFQHAYVPAK